MGELEDQPILCNTLYPTPNIKNNISREEDLKIAVTERTPVAIFTYMHVTTPYVLTLPNAYECGFGR